MAEYPKLIVDNQNNRVICGTDTYSGFVVAYADPNNVLYYLNPAGYMSDSWTGFDASTTLEGPFAGYEYHIDRPDVFDREGWEYLTPHGTWGSDVAVTTVPLICRRKAHMLTYPVLMRSKLSGALVCATGPERGLLVLKGKYHSDNDVGVESWFWWKFHIASRWDVYSGDPIDGIVYSLGESKGGDALHENGAWYPVNCDVEKWRSKPAVFRVKEKKPAKEDAEYYYLKPGDVIQEGDEYQKRPGFWGKTLCAGSVVMQRAYRRRKEPAVVMEPEPGPTYRILGPDETLQEGDEYQGYQKGHWLPVDRIGLQPLKNLVYRRPLNPMQTPEQAPKADWHFACQPEDFDFERILREAPPSARVVRVRLLGEEIVAYRTDAYEKALKALGGRKIGVRVYVRGTYVISEGALCSVKIHRSKKWRVTDPLPFDRSPYNRIVEWFADADEAEQKAKEKVERKAKRVEVSVTTV